MSALIVVDNPKRWRLRLRGAEVVSARDYLADTGFEGRRGLRVYNLCRTYGYQTIGYYVSLLAAARGHRPIPSVDTLQDLRLDPVVRLVSEQLEALVQRSLSRLKGPRFELSIYFGHNLARRYEPLARALYREFPVPLLRATFERDAAGHWSLFSLRPIATSEIPERHHDFVVEQAEAHFGRPERSKRTRSFRYDLAILHDPDAPDAPSDPVALRRFVRAAAKLDIEATLIEREDASAIGEFDALFIRETTYVDHYTYRIARRAEAEGLVVIDDSTSILRCTNKVYQAELFERHGIAHPKTVLVHEGNVDIIEREIGLPCVLKRPDSAFSQGVVKVETPEELRTCVADFLRDSELLVAQEYAPSSFDWRVGVLGRKPLYACRYHMARGHWQIIAKDKHGSHRYGRVEPMAIDAVPAGAIKVGVAAASRIGDGLYGVDVKERDGRFLVMEVNDNPNLESGCEDGILGEQLYLEVMRWFRERLDARGRGNSPG